MKLHIRFRLATTAVIELAIAGCTIGVRDLVLCGELTVRLEHILEELPLVGGIVAHFLDPPAIDYDLTGLAGIAEFPVFAGIFRRCVQDAIAGVLVIPNQLAIPLGTEEQGVDVSQIRMPTPIGLLHVRALRASGLMGKDVSILKGKKTSDPYVIVRLGEESWRSSTVKKTTDPIWPEEVGGYFFVFDRLQRVYVSVLDADFGKADDFLGVARPPPVSDVDAVDDLESDLELYDIRGQQLEELSEAGGPEKFANARCGVVTLSFQFLELLPGQLCGDRRILEVKVDGVTLPQRAGAEVKVVAQVGALPSRATPLARAQTASATRTSEGVVMNVVRGLIKRGMPAAEISEVTEVPVEEVESIRAGGALSRESARQHNCHVVEVESTLHFALEAQHLDEDLRLWVRDKKDRDIATHRIPLARVVAAAGHRLPGPLRLMTSRGEVISEVTLRLLGVRKPPRT